MKKTISLLLALVLVFSLAPTVFAEGPPTLTLSASAEFAQPGDIVTLTLTLDEDTTIGAAQFALTYDKTAYEVNTITKKQMSSGSDISNDDGTGTVRFIAFDIDDEPIELNSGTVCSVKFTALADKPDAVFSFAVENLNNTSAQPMAYELVSANITIPVSTPFFSYTVSMGEDQTDVAASTDVQIPVTIGHTDSSVTQYNDYDLSFTYDNTILLAKDTGYADDIRVTVDGNNGKLRIQRYGDTAQLGEPINLLFTAIASGTATVAFSEGKVDTRENAMFYDAPPAIAADDGEVKITVSGMTTYTVTYDAELITPQDGYTSPVNEGGSFVFKPKDASKTYTITYTMGGGDPVELTAGDGGWYTISNITGDVVITCTEVAAPNTYEVSFTGSGALDVAKGAASTVTAGGDYTFTINKAEGYTYTVTYKMGENDPVELTADGNEYTISNVTGDLVITVNKELTPPSFNVNVDSGYLNVSGKSFVLITVTGDPGDGKVFKYSGNAMYLARNYGTNVYSYLVIVDETAPTVQSAAENVTIEDGNVAGTIAGNDYNVNGSDNVDVNDAQITYGIYTGKYQDFETVSIEKFLRADVNGDKIVNSSDAVGIVANA